MDAIVPMDEVLARTGHLRRGHEWPGAVSGPVTSGRPAAMARRLHLQHGPIDLIVEAWGAPDAVAEAYRRAWERFRPLLDELVAELPALRRPLGEGPGPTGRVATSHGRSPCAPFPDRFITPMAAVAGAVADEICEAMATRGDLRRAYVNDGGDIALFLTPGESLDVGLVPVPDRPALLGKATVRARRPRARGRDQRAPRAELLARHRRCGDGPGRGPRRGPTPPRR